MRIEEEHKFDTIYYKALKPTLRLSKDKVLDKRDDDAHYMSLELEHHSSASIELSEKLMALAWSRSGGRNKPGRRSLACVGTIMGDLMEAAAIGRDGWGYRPYSAGSFTDTAVGFTVFTRIMKAFEALGYVEIVRGSRRQIASTVWAGHSSRFRATDALVRVAADAGVTPATRTLHYRVDDTAVAKRPVLILKSGKEKHRRVKSGGAPVRVDLTHALAAVHAKQMEEINAGFQGHTIELPALAGVPHMSRFKGFHRIFSCGGLPSYGYDKGGRAYPVGGSYQSIEREWRPHLLVNGELSAEIDIGSSQIRILFALLGKPIDASVDPYELPGIPRDVAKLWFAQTIGHNKLHRGWTPDNRKEYISDIQPGRDLSKDYRIRVVEAAALARWPLLKDWEACPFKWGTLQYEEAQIVIGAVHTLVTKHGVPAYPVHDSIIVPATDQELATRVLGESFQARFGVLPRMTVK